MSLITEYSSEGRCAKVDQLLFALAMCARLKLYLKLRSQCLATGRHKQLSTICIEQQPRNFIKSRDVLLNSEAYCFFPRASYLPYFGQGMSRQGWATRWRCSGCLVLAAVLSA